jgi:hypothetical protein
MIFGCHLFIAIRNLDKIVRILNCHTKTGPRYRYKTNHLKTQPFEYQNQKVFDLSNGPDFGIWYSDVDFIFEWYETGV